MDVTARKAYPLAVQQTVRSAAEKETLQARQKKRAQRPKKTKSKSRGQSQQG